MFFAERTLQVQACLMSYIYMFFMKVGITCFPVDYQFKKEGKVREDSNWILDEQKGIEMLCVVSEVCTPEATSDYCNLGVFRNHSH